MRKEYEHHDKPLYKWKLTDSKTIVKSDPIYDYNYVTWSRYSKYEFRIGDRSMPNYVKQDQLDRVIHSRYYSFDSSDEKATNAFLDYFKSKCEVAQAELAASQNALEDFKANNNIKD